MPLPLPPDRMPLWRDRRPLKRWRYVGVFAEEALLCFGSVRIAGVPQCFWAVWDRRTQRLAEKTSFRPRAVELPDGAVRVRDVASLTLEPAGEPLELVSPHGRSEIWTRKQPVRVRGEAGGIAIDAPGLLDDSAGYHARRTAWEWSAGAGRAVDGRAVWWNLVTGVHDGPDRSERAVWVDGTAHALPPVRFSEPLDAVDGEEVALRFSAEAERARRDELLIFASDYRQPFGTYAGTVGGIELASGLGVMERHSARW
ncbi:MAG TPA: DUF2804 family protein [Solirubrobacteraceae bacterium]|nr:DUF2804 family protein [Solirubrobacteraceae bacterium]